ENGDDELGMEVEAHTRDGGEEEELMMGGLAAWKESEEEEERALKEGVGRMSQSVKLLIASKIKETDAVGRYLKVGVSLDRARDIQYRAAEGEGDLERLVMPEDVDGMGGYPHLAKQLFLRGGAGELEKALSSHEISLNNLVLHVDAQQLLSRESMWLESSYLYIQVLIAWGLVDEVAFSSFAIQDESLNLGYRHGHPTSFEVVQRVPFPLFKKHFLPALASSSSSSSFGSESKRVKISLESGIDRARAQREHIILSPWRYNSPD
ncbi:hypothetical protein GOP47_0010898, partial [Adiantum capillus-veneris]